MKVFNIEGWPRCSTINDVGIKHLISDSKSILFNKQHYENAINIFNRYEQFHKIIFKSKEKEKVICFAKKLSNKNSLPLEIKIDKDVSSYEFLGVRFNDGINVLREGDYFFVSRIFKIFRQSREKEEVISVREIVHDTCDYSCIICGKERNKDREEKEYNRPSEYFYIVVLKDNDKFRCEAVCVDCAKENKIGFGFHDLKDVIKILRAKKELT